MTSLASTARGPLDGIRVLDLTLALAGPLCTQRLGDMGAEIIKIEGPKRGDFTRNAVMRDVRLGGETTCFLSVNRNKKSVAIDLKSERGLAVFMRLVKESDVVIQNMRPGVVERLGITFASLRQVNPRIVYVSISGYGDTGPMVRRPGQDLLVQCFSGTTFNAGTSNGAPHPAPVYIVDVAASHNACEAVLAGLIQRDRRGVAVEAKVSLLAAVLEIQIQEITTHLTTGKLGQRGEAPYASTWMEPPYGIYKTSDGYIAIAQSSLATIGEVLASDAIRQLATSRPEPSDDAELQRWRDSIYATLQRALIAWKTDDAVQALNARDVWCGPVMNYDELVAHPQSDGLFATIDHPRAGTIRTLAPAIQFSTHPSPELTPAPAIGEHTEQVLASFGFAAAELRSLLSEGVLA